MKVLTEKYLAHALFFSVKHYDFENVAMLLEMGAPVQTAFPIAQDQLAYTVSKNILTEDFFVGRVAETIKKYGPTHAKSRFVLDLLDKFIERGADFRCHCSAKNAHYCAISYAFKHLRFVTSEDLFLDCNLLILKLLFHGATYKNHKNYKDFKWTGIDTLLAYLSTRRQEAFYLIAKNRHSKCVGCKA